MPKCKACSVPQEDGAVLACEGIQAEITDQASYVTLSVLSYCSLVAIQDYDTSKNTWKVLYGRSPTKTLISKLWL